MGVRALVSLLLHANAEEDKQRRMSDVEEITAGITALKMICSDRS